MRADVKVDFIKEALPPVFDPSTGDYTDGGLPITKSIYCHVSDTGEKRMSFLYGAIKQGAKTVRLNTDNIPEYDYIEINGKPYQTSSKKQFRRKGSLDVIEV